MLLPRKWALGLGLLAATPGFTVAGPLDFLKQNPERPGATQPSERTNQEVAVEIGRALEKAQLTHQNVQIEYLAGTVTIKGQIRDASQKAQVSRLAQQVAGVQSVNNQLQLMNAMPTGQIQQAGFQDSAGSQIQQVQHEQAVPAFSNQEVAQNIAESLASAGLSGYDIEVRYKSGIASLVGAVENPEQAMRAQQATSMVPGVNQVLNKLTVKGRPADMQTAGRPPYGPPPGYPQMPAGQQMQGMPPGMGPAMHPGMHPGMAPGAPVQQVAGQAPGMPAAPPMVGPPQYGHAQPASHQIYNQPNVPDYAWPSYAPYDNSAAISYPSQYDASAFPYIGPYYPYPQVPLGWRKSTLEWDDGHWSLKFSDKTDRWWWFMNPHNWH